MSPSRVPRMMAMRSSCGTSAMALATTKLPGPVGSRSVHDVAQRDAQVTSRTGGHGEDGGGAAGLA